jgi:hypothetical protein
MKTFPSQKNKVAFEIVFFAILLFFSTVAQAEEKNSGPSISIVPHTFDLSIFPGEEVKDRIKLYNRGDIAIPFHLKLVGLDAKDGTGEMIIAELDAENTSFQDWIKFDKADFIIDSGQKEIVNFSLKIPADTKNQGYYFMLLLQADISTYYFDENRIQTIPNLGVPFLLKVGEEEGIEPLSILEYSASEKDRFVGAEKLINGFISPFKNQGEAVEIIKSTTPTFVVKLKNDSPYHTKLTGKIDLSGLGWKVKNQLELPALTILPGKTRELLVGATDEKNSTKEGSEKVLGFGVVRAGLELETQTGFQKKENLWALVFSWKMIGLLIFFILLFFGRKEIKKLRKIIFRHKKPPVDNFRHFGH